MRNYIFLCLGIILTSTVFSVPEETVIPNGVPNSPSFGYGARLDPLGFQVKQSIKMAGQFDLDWIAVEYDWARHQPTSSMKRDWDTLDEIVTLAKNNNLSVMVSISNPPEWVITSKGPSKWRTLSLIREFAYRYPNKIQAIELFPGVNTVQGWGNVPDPIAYATLLKRVQASLDDSNSGIILVSGGLLPISTQDSSRNMGDLEFLEELYASGASQFMPIVGIQLPAIYPDPTMPPRQSKDITLRHYEAIRNVMLENNHKNGLIWVTGFSSQTKISLSTADHSLWIKQAYLMMRRQLYIGTAYFQHLNPSIHHSKYESLLLEDGSLHPAFEEIGQIIAQENSSYVSSFEGTPSQGIFPLPNDRVQP